MANNTEPPVTKWRVTINDNWIEQVTAGSVIDAASKGQMIWRTNAAQVGEAVERLTVERVDTLITPVPYRRKKARRTTSGYVPTAHDVEGVV